MFWNSLADSGWIRTNGLLDDGQVEEQEAQFASGGDVSLALFGMGEEIELVGETVGGDGAKDVLAVEAEVAEVGVDGGAGASE